MYKFFLFISISSYIPQKHSVTCVGCCLWIGMPKKLYKKGPQFKGKPVMLRHWAHVWFLLRSQWGTWLWKDWKVQRFGVNHQQEMNKLSLLHQKLKQHETSRDSIYLKVTHRPTTDRQLKINEECPNSRGL